MGSVASGTETVDNDAKERYLWNITYVDALVAAELDTDVDGWVDEDLRVTYDANYNITSLIDLVGSAVERYFYSPYGQRTILDGSYGSRSTSSYGWTLGHQGLRLDGETGNYYNRARYLSPSLGMFGQRDPLGTRYQDGMNLNQYEGSNPLIYLDPQGESLVTIDIDWRIAKCNSDRCTKLKNWCTMILSAANPSKTAVAYCVSELPGCGFAAMANLAKSIIQSAPGTTGNPGPGIPGLGKTVGRVGGTVVNEGLERTGLVPATQASP